MKYFIAIVLIIFTQLHAIPEAEFVSKTHDFGNIEEAEGLQTHIFRFRNTGNSNLRIIDVKSSCRCTTSDWTKAEVAPQNEGCLKITFDPANRPGRFTKRISVITNCRTTVIDLFISGNVIPAEGVFRGMIGPLKSSSSKFDLGTIKDTEITIEKIEFVNETENSILIKVLSKADYYDLNVYPNSIQPKESGYFELKLFPDKVTNYGMNSELLSLHISSSVTDLIRIPLVFIVEEDFGKLSASDLNKAPTASIEQKFIQLGNVKRGEKQTVQIGIKNSGKSDLIIRGLQTGKDCRLITKPEIILPNERKEIILEIIFNSVSKNFVRSIFIISNDPSKPSQTVKISAQIAE